MFLCNDPNRRISQVGKPILNRGASLLRTINNKTKPKLLDGGCFTADKQNSRSFLVQPTRQGVLLRQSSPVVGGQKRLLMSSTSLESVTGRQHGPHPSRNNLSCLWKDQATLTAGVAAPSLGSGVTGPAPTRQRNDPGFLGNRLIHRKLKQVPYVRPLA